MNQQTAADHLPDAGKMIPEDHSGDVNKMVEEIAALKKALSGSREELESWYEQINERDKINLEKDQTIFDLRVEIELLKEALKGSKVIADEAAHQIRAAQSVIDTYTRKIHDLQEELHASRVAAGQAELERAKAVKEASEIGKMFAKETAERADLFWENKALKQRIEKMENNVRKALKQLL